MVYALKRQPLKALYLTFALPVTLLVRLPFWCVYYLPRFNRPRRSWKWWQCIQVNLIRTLADLGDIPEKTGPLLSHPTHHTIPKDKYKSVWIEPTPALVFDPLKKFADAAKVEPVRIPGYWYDREGKSVPVGDRPRPGEKVLYYLHGGGYVGMSAHPSSIYAYLINRLTTTLPNVERTLAVEYRLTTGPPDELTNPFPAALLDAIAGYAYLINVVGFKPENIILGGDSAGGNLALALTRYLVEAGRLPEAANVLPKPPSNLILICPWSDLGSSHETPGASVYVNLESDFIGPVDDALLKHARVNYVGPLGFPEAANTNSYLSPGSKHPSMPEVSFKDFPRTFIVWGEAEILVDQVKTLWRKMTDQLGEEQVGWVAGKDAPHDFMLLESFEEQNDEAYGALEKWFTSQ
ncbi:unnamed protein product [Somion occarium]|uniref:Alpha/beta hydrolase fold-3 domain-containing protein n=1 Tax=Somion occarium TaxID=3059160 RepID=A0ABP1DK74_9APHY